MELAATHIDPVFLNTPQFVSEALGDELGVEFALKVEVLNPTRSFKGRGAELLVARVSDRRPLICASAGNFGQAMAFACRKREVPLTVFVATTANRLKVERIRRMGAEVIESGEDFDAAKLAARHAAHERGWRFVEDGRDEETVEGAGTIAWEWLRAPSTPDVWLIPLGNGGLLNGIGRVVKAVRPAIRIIGVQAAGAPAMLESWRAGRLVSHARIATIADGIGVREPIPAAVDELRRVLDDGLLVDDEQILSAMRLLQRHVGLVIEPSGAVGVAAVLAHPDRFRGQRVGTVLCGGNVTDAQLRTWLAFN
jgi:threonine dehydratase